MISFLMFDVRFVFVSALENNCKLVCLKGAAMLKVDELKFQTDTKAQWRMTITV